MHLQNKYVYEIKHLKSIYLDVVLTKIKHNNYQPSKFILILRSLNCPRI
jgi:hypothetical protein